MLEDYSNEIFSMMLQCYLLTLSAHSELPIIDEFRLKKKVSQTKSRILKDLNWNAHVPSMALQQCVS